MPYANAVDMTQKQLGMFLSVLPSYVSQILLQGTDLWAMVDIHGHNSRHPVPPAPRSPYGATLSVFSLYQSFNAGSNAGTRPHRSYQPSPWAACNRMVRSVQHLFLSYLYFLSHCSCYPLFGNISQPMGLLQSCGP